MLAYQAPEQAHQARLFPLDIELNKNIGGARRDRADDLNTASVALSQLSYGPTIEYSKR